MVIKYRGVGKTCKRGDPFRHDYPIGAEIVTLVPRVVHSPLSTSQSFRVYFLLSFLFYFVFLFLVLMKKSF